LEAGIGVPSRSAVAQAARILKLDFPMNYNDDSAAGVSDREPMAESETEWIAGSSRMRQAYATTRLGREATIFLSTLCIPRTWNRGALTIEACIPSSRYSQLR
jgi:hypothetical protein